MISIPMIYITTEPNLAQSVHMYPGAINNRSVRILFIDGTFKTTPKFFTQTWIIRCYIGDSIVAVPFAYILLEDKSTASYLRALQLLSDAAPLLFPATVSLILFKLPNLFTNFN